ncbi:MAG: efflux RND transporter permease subunit [bacterium]|nr:efflux RND transporter permease subunit [bacterium]
MSITSISVKRPVLATMFTVMLVVLGLFSYTKLSIRETPNIDTPWVTISTIYPGASPEEIESQVTIKIEDAVSTISDVKKIESISRESYSFVMMEFELEADADDAANDVRAKVDATLNDLPDDVEKPVIAKYEIGAAPIIQLAVSGDQGLNATYALADEMIRDRLSQVSGVANVEIVGGQEREIQVRVDRDKLDYYGLGIGVVNRMIAMENANVPGGRITQREREFTIRTLGEFASLEDLASVRIPLGDQGFIRLRDIAEIHDGFEEARSLARHNGEPTILVDVIKRSDANTVKVADGLYDIVDDLRADLPAGFELEIVSDDSIFVRDAIKDVLMNILFGILLTAVLLFTFLRNFRATLIVAVVMPATIIATFMLIMMANFTLNILSLMALGISVGILVTNAIVVIENVIRHLREGKTPEEAAIVGTNEVILAVLASVLTNVVVFVPIAFMEGLIGKFFLEFGLTVVFATIFSLVISFTLTPMLCAYFLRLNRKRTGGDDAAETYSENRMERFIAWLGERYRGLLAWSLAKAWHRVVLVVVTVGMLMFGLFLMGQTGGEFSPKIDQSKVTVDISLPAGTSLEKSRQAVIRVEEVLAGKPYVKSLTSSVGGGNSGVNEASVLVHLIDRSERDRWAYEISDALRGQFAAIPGAEISVTGNDSEGGGKDAEIEVLSDDPDVLIRTADAVLKMMQDHAWLADIESSREEGGRELVFTPNREEIFRSGLATAQVAMSIRNAFEGDDSAVYREEGEEYPIRVRFGAEQRDRSGDLRDLRLAVEGDLLPLGQLGEIEEKQGEAQINRRDRQRRVVLSANLARGTISELVAEFEPRFETMNLPAGTRVRFGGMYEIQEESFAAIFQAMILAMVLTYVVLAMILESFWQPFTVMITLPLGLIGSALGLYLSGQTINVMSLMAMVMLVGIVVNNAILLLDYVSQLRAKGRGLDEAILEACPLRLRAVIMTNLAIAIGMIPQCLGTGSGIEYRLSMAFVTIGGVLVSAVFTLILIPSIYASVERGVARVRGTNLV